jgi:hypothetical protein
MPRPARESSLKAGARDRHDPAVKAAAEAQATAAKKEKKAKKKAAEAQKESQKVEKTIEKGDEQLRRRAKAIRRRLKAYAPAGGCGVRLRLRTQDKGPLDPWRKPPRPWCWFVLRAGANRLSETRHTCWVWCPESEDWHNPDAFYSPWAQYKGARHAPRRVSVGSAPLPSRWPAAAAEAPTPLKPEEVADKSLAEKAVGELMEWMVQALEGKVPVPAPPPPQLPPPPPPPTPVALPPMDAETRKRAKAVRLAARARREAAQERARAAKVEEARRWDELVQAATTGEVSSDEDVESEEDPKWVRAAAAATAAAAVEPVRIAVRLHASAVVPGRAVLSCRAAVAGAPPLPECAKPPAATWFAEAAAACVKAAAEWEREAPLARAQRQKVHWWKDEAGMSDGVLYKHLRDHNLEHAEAQAEVERRRGLIREGKGGEYAPPEMGRPVLGLLDGEPVPYPKADRVVDPWADYLAERSANQVTALAGAHWNMEE